MAKSATPRVAGPGVTAFAITAGVLQRSVDGGRSWQDAVRPDHPLLCYASYGAEVWAGGQAGALYRSLDNGVTWLPVRPSTKDQTLSSDITRIVIRDHISDHIRDSVQDNATGPVEVVVSTNNNQTWTSVDAGKTWERH
jgi:photosystem II stability/assembly factor-like uncharacterized protein